jgi:hypothetical protein
MTTSLSLGGRFIAAFNDIEAHLRATLGEDVNTPFAKMVRTSFDKRRLTVEQRDALLDFAELRNVISHSRYLAGKPMADPLVEAVQQIAQIRDSLCSPTRALDALEMTGVCRVDTQEQIGVALKHIEENGFSQLPVYDADTFLGLLTTNAIARWLAAQFAAHSGMAEDEPVGEVLKFAETYERARHLPRTATVVQVINALTHNGPDARPATAVIISQSGKTTERPLAIAVAHDLPLLYAEIALTR